MADAAFLILVAVAMGMSFLAGIHRGRHQPALAREGAGIAAIAFALIALLKVLP